MKLAAGAWLLAAMLFTAPAQARQAEMIDLPYRVVNGSAGNAVTLAQVDAAIREGARIQGWTVAEREPGRIQLHMTVNTHAMDVVVKYDARGFDMDYLSSVDLDFQEKRGTRYIHPNYNFWTANLADTIASAQALEPDFVAEDENALRLPPVKTTLKLTGPVHVYRSLSYRRGIVIDDAIRHECAWNQSYAGMAQYAGKGLVKVTREDIATLPGYALRATVINLRADDSVGSKWAVVHVELFDNGKLIGETEIRRVTTMPLKGACESLNRVAGALAEDSVAWLLAGKFEARADAARLAPMPAASAVAPGAPAATESR